MRLPNFRGMIALLLFAGLALAAAFVQAGDGKPLSDLPRQFAATAFGQAGSMAGKSFGLNIYITNWTTEYAPTSAC